MNPLVVVAPATVAAGFALGGASVTIVGEGADSAGVEQAVEAALASGPEDGTGGGGTVPEVVAVHHELWNRASPGTRRRWEERTDRLVLSLPPDDGVPAEERAAELHELLARAVGYEITFTPGGSP